MKKIYTINYDYDYVFYNYENAVETVKDIRQRFREEEFYIYTIQEDEEEYTEYAQYAQ